MGILFPLSYTLSNSPQSSTVPCGLEVVERKFALKSASDKLLENPIKTPKGLPNGEMMAIDLSFPIPDYDFPLGFMHSTFERLSACAEQSSTGRRVEAQLGDSNCSLARLRVDWRRCGALSEDAFGPRIALMTEIFLRISS